MIFRTYNIEPTSTASYIFLGQITSFRNLTGRNTNSPTSHGKIERVITQDDVAGSTGVTVHASPENPRYEVCLNRLKCFEMFRF